MTFKWKYINRPWLGGETCSSCAPFYPYIRITDKTYGTDNASKRKLPKVEMTLCLVHLAEFIVHATSGDLRDGRYFEVTTPSMALSTRSANKPHCEVCWDTDWIYMKRREKDET